MKKFLSLMILVAGQFFSSCEPIDYECPLLQHKKEQATGSNKPSSTNKYLHAESLYGGWQCSYELIVRDERFYEVRFTPDGKCDVIKGKLKSTDRETVTMEYQLYGSRLIMSSNLLYYTIYFTITDWTYPVLTIYDQYGTYTLTKRTPL